MEGSVLVVSCPAQGGASLDVHPKPALACNPVQQTAQWLVLLKAQGQHSEAHQACRLDLCAGST